MREGVFIIGRHFFRQTVPILLAAALLLFPINALGKQSSNDIQETITKVVSHVKPALIRIRVITVDYREGREVKREISGSGVIISKDGYAITNHHVAAHAKQIFCTLADKSEIDAELVGTDPLADIAVIKLLPPKKTEFPIAKFGDSSKVKVGDRVFAMGSPLSFSQSVTMGIVSNTELVMPDMIGNEWLTLDGEEVGSIVRWIAHDADIYPGNSGGPLVNMNGEIIGINEIDIGLGGAIPGNLVRDVAEQLITKGKVSRSWIGIFTQRLLKSSGSTDGILINGVLDDSPADVAGFKPGDILLSIDGKACNGRLAEEMPIFNQLIMGLAAGKEVEAIALRDGKNIPLKIIPAERDNAKAVPEELKEWGICAGNITKLDAKKMRREKLDGVLVTGVRPGGPAGEAKPMIREDDIITEVAGQPIKGIDDLRRISQDITKGKTEQTPTIVAFERDNEEYLTVVKLGIRELQDPGLEVRKAWLPINSQVLTRDIAQELGMPDRTGVRITQVYPNTSAEKAGLQVGDIIVALDGTPIYASEPEDTEVLPSMVRQYKIGSTAQLTVLRDGQESPVSVELSESPKLAREMTRYQNEEFEFTVRDICFFDKVQNEWPADQLGILVTSVGEGGWASLGDLSVDDLIVAIDGQPVQDVTACEQIMEKIKADKPKTLIMLVKQELHDKYVEIEPSWKN